MKIVVKRMAIGLVLCLAVVGAFALLKKAPDLDVSHEDHGYLETVTGSKMRSSRPNESGLSSILNDSMQGVPQIGGNIDFGSSAPPSSLDRATAAPSYGSPDSEAPAFSVSAASEAPPFLTAAPAFPVASASQPVEAVQTPSYGTQFQEAPTFQPAPAPAAAPIPPTPVPSAAPATPAPAPPDAPPISASPPPWGSGPAQPVVAMPSSVPVEPRGAFGVSGGVADPDFWISPPAPMTAPVTSQAVPPSGLVDPWPLEIVPAAERDRFSSAEVSSLEDALNPPRIHPPVAPPAPVEEKPMFVRPEMKRLPQVETPNMLAAVITESDPPHSPEPVTSERILPEDYRQTSMRNTIVLESTARSSEDAAPKISFSTPLTPVQPDPQANPLTFSDPPYIAEAPTSPFVATEAVAVEPQVKQPPERTIAVPRQSPTAVPSAGLSRIPTPSEPDAEMQKPEIRATVRRFVDAQRKATAPGDAADMRNAYIQLSKLYDHPELNDEERAYLTPTLDRLALEVVFSCKNHVLEPAYVVQPGDSIDSVAAKYHLSSALLMKINGLTGARPLKPGTQLKVVLGQFDAKLSARRGELVLILGGLYAGRFPVTVGAEVANVRGEFVVLSKSDSYKGKSLTLSNGVRFCSSDRSSPDELLTDAFCLSQRDAGELFDILTERSVIVLED